MTQGIPCMNCKRQVTEDQGRVFAEVFVCADCHKMAESLYNRCDGELRRLLLMLRESIRIALVEGKLQLGPALTNEDIPKAELLNMISELTEKKLTEKKNAAPR